MAQKMIFPVPIATESARRGWYTVLITQTEDDHESKIIPAAAGG